ncbi:hypothetical protein O9929_26980 [Vibrio lentus]|nr:hypothetical protein [Vibrio lentus]
MSEQQLSIDALAEQPYQRCDLTQNTASQLEIKSIEQNDKKNKWVLEVLNSEVIVMVD